MDGLQPPLPIRTCLRDEWLLDPRISFLNHGSFGALPKSVFIEQTRWRLRIEAEPIELLGRQSAELLRESRAAVGQWLNMPPDDFGFVTNATEGINAVLRSLKLSPGDELVTTTHVYNAIRQSMKHVAAQAGAFYREIDIPVPVKSADQIAQQVMAGLSPQTRLLVIDHITSPTALVFPVEQITALCAERSVDVLVDGAHAPGMVPLDVRKSGAAYYAGNLHKWAAAPKGSGFLYVRPDRQAEVHPLVVSHHLGEGFAREFAWQGTRDISGWLCIPAGLQFMSQLGWDAVMSHNHQMAAWAQRMLCETWGVEPISPRDGTLLGSMSTVLLPQPLQSLTPEQIPAFQQKLYSEHRIEVPLMRWSGRNYLRPCCQVYNTPAEYRRLTDVIVAEAR